MKGLSLSEMSEKLLKCPVKARRPVGITAGSPAILFVQDYAEETTMNRQSCLVVVDKAKLSELVHEMADPRPGRADHLCQRVLIHCWNHGFGSTLLAEMGQKQENTSQTLLARIKKLVDEVCLVSDVAR